MTAAERRYFRTAPGDRCGGNDKTNQGRRVFRERGIARKPLPLYDVTEVVPDASITLCDALLTEPPPLVVIERSGSRSLRAGMQTKA